jgi:hypothetical protein
LLRGSARFFDLGGLRHPLAPAHGCTVARGRFAKPAEVALDQPTGFEFV